jgi:GDPmannose 4,6-dehydratase
VARIQARLQDALYVGNLDAVRDWGYAPEYVEGVWMMLPQDPPDDYVLRTGVPATVRDFCREAFAHADLDWDKFVRIDAQYQRHPYLPRQLQSPAQRGAPAGPPAMANPRRNPRARANLAEANKNHGG